jgi:hypothetical protein
MAYPYYVRLIHVWSVDWMDSLHDSLACHDSGPGLPGRFCLESRGSLS